MIVAEAKLKSTSPYSQSRYIQSPKRDDETHEQHEERVWRERMHNTEDGHVQMPPMAFKKCVEEAAKDLGLKMGRRSYAKLFQKAIMVIDPVRLPDKVAEVQRERLFVPSDGQAGSGSRVTKIFGKIFEWEGTVRFLVLDNRITQEVFERSLRHAGRLIGLGRFRPERGGYYGRFDVVDVKWQEEKEE